MEGREFKLLVISPEEQFPEEVKRIHQLFEAGLCCLHLRKPGWDFKHLLRFALQIDSCFHPRIMVHYQEDLLQETTFRGVHYQAGALPVSKPPFTTSCGLHSWKEFQELEGRFDYAFVSPFYRSISKKDYPPNPALPHIPAGVKRERAIALGGISAGNLAQVYSMGLGGVAVLGSIWQSRHPLKSFCQLQEQIKELNQYV